MRLLLNNLATGWLVLALIMAPLQAMALPMAMVAGNDCAEMQTRHHSSEEHRASDHAKAQCKRCTGQCCDDGQCVEINCFSAHYQLSMPDSGLSVYGNPLVSIHPDYHEIISSQAPNPPFRPPV